MWERLLAQMLHSLIRKGRLRLILPSGAVRSFGGEGPEITVHLRDPDLPRRIVMNPDLAAGEGYMDGTMTIDGDDLHGFLRLVLENRAMGNTGLPLQINALIRQGMRRLHQNNPVARARHNVAHHYDLSGDLYDLFLDSDRQYSCAYFKTPRDTLEQAQAQKKAHIAAKLRIEPGMRVLDIGCGWGGMALTLARDHGARVCGVTLSREQHRVATARAAKAGLTGQIDIRMVDYRQVAGQFDRIVSVGMFEHVGAPHYREYFEYIHTHLDGDGIALVHTIGRMDPPGTTSPWILKYIFPGGYCPAMSEVLPHIEKSGLWMTDMEVWRLHYAETLRHWYDRFMANHDTALALYDARFCRMWRYYLVASEMTFRCHNQAVYQLQLSKRQDAVPLTRDYLYR